MNVYSLIFDGSYVIQDKNYDTQLEIDFTDIFIWIKSLISSAHIKEN